MKNVTWMDVIVVVGIVAIVGSLIFVGMQMRQSQRIATADYYQQQAVAARENSELALMHSDLVAKANRGEILTDADSFVLNKYVISQWQSAFFSKRRSEYLDQCHVTKGAGMTSEATGR